MRPALVAISGFSSEVGKTTLVCDLLRCYPAWEAIKVTRGHYRSCGKDPHACCVSHILGDKPLVFSGREQTYKSEKDTGRFWDAGASNVHWVVGTDQQVTEGLESALSRVTSAGVFIEGTSILKQFKPDYSVMVVKPELADIKSSAVSVFSKVDGVFITEHRDAKLVSELVKRVESRGVRFPNVPIYFREDTALISQEIDRIVETRKQVLI